MRRGVSIATLLMILASVLAPLAQAQSSTLPACCRAGGKHHCDGSMGSLESVGFKAVPETCSYRHHAAVTSEAVALPAANHRISVFVLERAAVQPSALSFYSYDRNDAHKRGPPTA